MIHVDKNGADFPEKLNSEKTNQRRAELIDAGKYIDADVYNSRYKTEDIKRALKEIYHYKCAFCEQKIESFHVEHYRPKADYYWLAYSWDNLLLVCPACNTSKLKKFTINGKKASFNDVFIENIHASGQFYDQEEQPFLINPESDQNPERHFVFFPNGRIEATDKLGAETIEICNLNRPYLVEEKRKKVFDSLKQEIEAHYIAGDWEKVKNTIARFVETIRQKDQFEFIALRKDILNFWLKPFMDNLERTVKF